MTDTSEPTQPPDAFDLLNRAAAMLDRAAADDLEPAERDALGRVGSGYLDVAATLDRVGVHMSTPAAGLPLEPGLPLETVVAIVRNVAAHAGPHAFARGAVDMLLDRLGEAAAR